LENAVKGVISGIFAATGQTCIAGSRLLVQKSIQAEFTGRLVEFARTARMGDPSSIKFSGQVFTVAQLDNNTNLILHQDNVVFIMMCR
jgi:(Z)-2-((N-methylformamido)methylene)-5-hydroxybutyrolactone dehydrogenase